MGCISNAQYTTAANEQAAALVGQAKADAVIQIGIALWQRNSSKSIKNMQIEIADRQMKLAEEVQAHAAMYWPEEKELVDDIFGIAKVSTAYAPLVTEFGGLVEGTLQQGRENWIATMRNWCMSPSRCEDARWQRNTQLVRSDMMSHAARQDENRTQILNDRRFAYQYAALQLGKGQLANLLSYQQIGGAIGMNATDMLTTTANTAMKAFGYYPNREEQTGWGSGIRDTFMARSGGNYNNVLAQGQQEFKGAPAPLMPPVATGPQSVTINNAAPKLGDGLRGLRNPADFSKSDRGFN